MGPDEKLESLLKRRTGFARLLHVDTCDSTQDLANERPVPGNGAPPDAVFWADHQLRGRGRQQRHWHDEIGLDVAATFRVTAEFPQPLALPAALPVAVLEACEPLAGRPLRIKWPNDVYAGGEKLSGVLIDRDSALPHTYRIGIGVNVNRTTFPPELQAQATSLRLLCGRELDRHEVLLQLAEAVDTMVRAVRSQQLDGHERIFRERLGLLGERVEVEAGRATHRGVLTDVDFSRLVLDGRTELPLAIVAALRRAE